MALAFATTSLQAATLWIETSPDNLKEDSLIEFNVGYADDFDLVDLGARTLGNIVFPALIGKGGESSTIKEIAPSYAFVTESTLKAGSYIAYSSYKPFISAQEGQPKNKYVFTATHLFNIGAVEDDLVTKPTGKIPLEIVPETHPLRIFPGSPATFQVLLDGKPLPKAQVLGEPKGYNPPNSPTKARAYYSPTDDQGKIRFTPLKPGLWILSVRTSIPNPNKSDSDNIVYIHNLTFYVADAAAQAHQPQAAPAGAGEAQPAADPAQAAQPAAQPAAPAADPAGQPAAPAAPAPTGQ
jgi:uncharacterized GH25 family protein